MLQVSQLLRRCAYRQHAAWVPSAGCWLQGQQSWLSTQAPRSAAGPAAGLYAVLGVGMQASQEDIKQAFRQRAKELHPDMAHGPANPEPFLTLVTAYEVLSNPDQRQRYDAAVDADLPPFMRAAAAGSMSRRQQAGGSDSMHRSRSRSDEGDEQQAQQRWQHQQWQQQDGWRYGWDEWARSGPAVATEADAAQRRGVMGALQRYRNTLEAELHDALMMAYLGPRLEIQEGQLPPAFEAEERSHPVASRDLLHLVSGRTLLGLVREKQQLHLEGGAVDIAGQLYADSSQQYSTAQSRLPFTSAMCSGQQPQQQPPHGACAAHGLAAHPHVCDLTDMSDDELDSLLDAEHRLRGSYDWVQQEEPGIGEPQQLQAQLVLQAQLLSQASSTSNSSDGARVTSGSDVSTGGTSSSGLCMGACQARLAWTQRMQAGAAGNTDDLRSSSGSSSSSSSSSQANTTQSADVPSLGQALAEGLAEGVQEAVQSLMGKQTAHAASQCSDANSHNHTGAADPTFSSSSAAANGSSAGSTNENSQSSGRRKRRAKWRRVLDPTPEWRSADWSFSDADEGVTVLEMQLNSQMAAVAVRCDTQHLRPTKIYINDRFTVALLDDIIMEPHTGGLVAAIYKMYTPGVLHAWFYRPQGPQSRLLARLKRCWLPPSGAWLFAPRDEGHNVGGWYFEHEGHQSSHKPGWLHPCVYVLTAALDSLDRERRRQQTSAAYTKLWQRSGLAGLSRWLRASRS